MRLVICRTASSILMMVHSPYGLRSAIKGISHGLKMCHRHVFLTAFRFPYGKKKTSCISRRFFYLVNDGARNTNTMP